MKRALFVVSLLLPIVVWAQRPSGPPKVSAVPMDTVVVKKGGSVPVKLRFRVAPGYHINSHEPKEETLLPTVVHFDVPTDISLAGMTYPEGQLVAFPFDPSEKLSVYSGDFTVKALVNAAKSTPKGTYRVHATLRYQACDNRACYPPSNLPTAFDVKVVPPPVAHRRSANSAASPHIHN